MNKMKKYVTVDPATMRGIPVFKDTRIPVSYLFDHLSMGYNIQFFVDIYPSVTLEQAKAVIKMASRLFNKVNNLKK